MEEHALAIIQHVAEDQITEPSDAPETVTIRQLHPASTNKVLEARVYRKWVAVTYSKKDVTGFSGKKKETGFCCILIDKEGNAIQGNMSVKEIDHFDPKIKLGRVYRISEFVCEPTSPYQQTINNKTSLKFGKATKFDAIEVPDIPHHYFQFVSYNQLPYRVAKEDETGKMQYPILTDYMGCLRSPGEVIRKQNANGNETVYRKLDIENLNGNIVEFTMWDDMAEKFGDADLDTMEQPVMIAVSSCRVTKYRDYQLTATSATYYYLNPQIPEVNEARARYRERYQRTPPLRITKTPYQDIEKEKLRNRFPLKTLLKQEPETYNAVRFTTDATVTSIDLKRGWYYMSCNQCACKVTEEEGMYRCINHGRQPTPLYKYNFKAYITDPSATALVTFFSPAADDITGYSCSELLASHTSEDTQEIPKEIFAIEGERNIFQIHFNLSARTTEFIADQVFNKKIRQQEKIPLIQASSATPPTPVPITIQQDVEPAKNAQSRSANVRRPLFQDDLPDAKKQKETAPTAVTITSQLNVDQQKTQEGDSQTPDMPSVEADSADAKSTKAGSSLAGKIKKPNVTKKKPE